MLDFVVILDFYQVHALEEMVFVHNVKCPTAFNVKTLLIIWLVCINLTVILELDQKELQLFHLLVVLIKHFFVVQVPLNYLVLGDVLFQQLVDVVGLSHYVHIVFEVNIVVKLRNLNLVVQFGLQFSPFQLYFLDSFLNLLDFLALEMYLMFKMLSALLVLLLCLCHLIFIVGIALVDQLSLVL